MADYLQTTYNGAQPVTTSDTVLNHFRALIIAATGDLKVTPAVGAAVTFTGLAAGCVIPIETSLVWATGTTATVIGLC